jgi:hypothetical protein
MQTSEAGGFILSLKSQIAGEQEDDADPNVLSFVSLDDFKKKIGGCTAMSDAQKEVLIDHVAKHCMPMPGEVAYCPGTLEPPCPSGPPVVG